MPRICPNPNQHGRGSQRWRRLRVRAQTGRLPSTGTVHAVASDPPVSRVGIPVGGGEPWLAGTAIVPKENHVGAYRIRPSSCERAYAIRPYSSGRIVKSVLRHASALVDGGDAGYGQERARASARCRIPVSNASQTSWRLVGPRPNP